MGVPKFFRWLGERYPMVITTLSDPKPEVDNLYLDMNGIVHVCCRTESDDTASLEAISEEAMIRAIYSYLEHIFANIRPKKRFFMAIDGVAPRAKLNQQRQRRFRKVMAEGEAKLADDVGFDSNCITPGTSFMLRLSTCIEYFINYKISTHAAWRSCEIIYSSHRDPGEGEHKIMSFIRSQRGDTTFPNETHCLYGLDADLIMLSLSTHMPNFMLLREVVHFGSHWKDQQRAERMKTKGIAQDKSLETPSEFVLLHVKILREYLAFDLNPTDIEKAIDDFVFLCFLLGNDFLPGLPGMSISEGAIADLLALYKKHCIEANQCIVRDGSVDWMVLRDILSAIAKQEWQLIEKKLKVSKKNSEVETGILSGAKNLAEYRKLYYGHKLEFTDESEVKALSRAFIEGLMWVFQYYYTGCADWGWYFRYHYAPLASDLIDATETIPRVRFTLGKPFTPYEQLLAVLPPESHRCVPESLQRLMLDADSSLQSASFYPKLNDVRIDREGCRNEWEGVMLLPFIDEKFLQECFQSVYPSLSDAEKQNNQPEPAVVYSYDPNIAPVSVIRAPFANFPNVENCYVKKTVISLESDATVSLTPPTETFPDGIGSFHTLRKTIKIALSSKETRVFGQNSRNPSMIVDVSNGVMDFDILSQSIGSVVSIGYPFVKKALLVAVHNEQMAASGVFDAHFKLQQVNRKAGDDHHRNHFHKVTHGIEEKLLASCGMRTGAIKHLLHVRHVLGVRLLSAGACVTQFQEVETVYPAQLLVDSGSSKKNGALQSEHILPKELIQCDALFLPQKGSSYAGTVGKIEAVYSKKQSDIRLRMSFAPARVVDDKAFFTALPESFLSHLSPRGWKSSIEVCHAVRLPHRALMSLCDSILCTLEGEDIQLGLQLIDQQSQLGRIGYVKLVKHTIEIKSVSSSLPSFDGPSENPHEPGAGKTHSRTWYFSMESQKLIQRFTHLFRPLLCALPTDVRYPHRINLDTLLVENCAPERLAADAKSMRGLLQSAHHEMGIGQSAKSEAGLIAADENVLPQSSISRIEQILTENESIRISPMERGNSDACQAQGKSENIKDIHFSNIFVPHISQKGTDDVSLSTPSHVRHPDKLLQRVVYCGSTGTVPFGARGCVTRILPDGKHAEVLFDDAFLECSRLKGRLRTHRGSVLKRSLLVVTSSWEDHQKKKPPIVKEKRPARHGGEKFPTKQNPERQRTGEIDVSAALGDKLSLGGQSDKKAVKKGALNPKASVFVSKKEDQSISKPKTPPKKPISPKRRESIKACIFGKSCMIKDEEHLKACHRAE